MSPADYYRHHSSGVPGLRLIAADGSSCFLRHLPTGADLVLTRSRETPCLEQLGAPSWLAEDYPPDAPLSRYERIALDSVPPISPDAAVLLAALISRLNVTDDGRQWATGMWDGDPLRRNHPHQLERARYLWGAGDQWDLHWWGAPQPSDLVAALTDPRIGVEGIAIEGHGRRRHRARLGTAELVFGRPD